MTTTSTTPENHDALMHTEGGGSETSASARTHTCTQREGTQNAHTRKYEGQKKANEQKYTNEGTQTKANKPIANEQKEEKNQISTNKEQKKTNKQ
jgi:hypothetical protein